jgi:hypothetical protein
LNLEKTASRKKKKDKDESILSTEINLTTSSDESEWQDHEEYLLRAIADMLPEAASFLRDIPQTTSSKLMTVIQPPGIK